MSLAGMGLASHPVARKATEFLVNGAREDGSWAIDSNLATWVTTLSVNALAAAGELDRLDRKEELRDWLLKHHGIDHYLRAMRDWSAHRGQACGVAFAEGFRQHLGHSYPQDNLLGQVLGTVGHSP